MIQAETLELLEWPRLCQHLATFAATKLGALAARHFPLPQTQGASLRLLAQTREVVLIDSKLLADWSFQGITDFGPALERAELGGIIPGETLLELATSLSGIRRLRRAIEGLEDGEVPELTALVAEARTYPELEREIHRCLEDDGRVAERASPKLGAIRSKMGQLRGRIQTTLQRIVRNQPNALQDATLTQRSDRFVLAVKATHKEAIPGILHDISGTGATLYIEPKAVVELGNQLRQAQRQHQIEEEKILRVLTEQVEEVREDLERLLAIATTLDLATARARYSLWLEAHPPRFVDLQKGETTSLRGLCHPLLLWQQRHEEGPEVVPINVSIDPQVRVVAITGPNTGGKTVTLKTIGLAALMARAGLYVPAREPVEMPWFEAVLADIGDEQSIEQSLSTFSGHIRRICRILTELGSGPTAVTERVAEPVAVAAGGPPLELVEPAATPSRSLLQPVLVLLDEVGAGTDPTEGSAIAAALLQAFADRAQLTIATTHYGELKALKYQDPRFENASVEFNEATLAPTYRLLWGIPGRSNALAIAGRLGLDAEIVERARARMGGEALDVNEVIAGLEDQRRQQETKAREARILLQQAEAFYQEVSERAAALQAREQDLKRSQEQAIGEAIAAAKAEIAGVIRTLQKSNQPTAQQAQQATAALQAVGGRHLPKAPKAQPKPGYKPVVGDRVRVPRLGQTAEVLTAPTPDGKLDVRFGLMKMTVTLADIESLDGKKADVPTKTTKAAATARTKKPKPDADAAESALSRPTVRTPANTLDIRGARVAEAEPDLEAAIARADNVVWIIHGKGTGKLRQGVHEFLKRHPAIARFELAANKEGGAGVTVAYLK
ncbi:MAG: endonuclease MutS2 [Cyanobacteria bacterium J06641_5]